MWDYWDRTGLCVTKSGLEPYFCKGDYRIRADLGGTASLAQGIAQVRADCGTPADPLKCGRVILYIEPFITGYGPDYMNQFGDLLWARNSDATVWQPFPKSVTLSYAHSGWQDYFVQTAKRLVADTGADGMFVDSGGWRLNELVRTKGEIVQASPYEHARGFLDLMDRTRNAIRTVPGHADAVVLSENASGPVSRHIDGGLSSDFAKSFPSPRLDKILATPTRTYAPQVNLFGNGVTLNEMNQVFATGHNLALANNSTKVSDNFIYASATYIKRLITIRRSLASSMVEGQESDIDVNSLTQTRMFGTAATAVNVDTAPHTIHVPFNFPYPVCDLVSRQQFFGSPSGFDVIIGPAGYSCIHNESTQSFPVCGLRVFALGYCSEFNF